MRKHVIGGNSGDARTTLAGRRKKADLQQTSILSRSRYFDAAHKQALRSLKNIWFRAPEPVGFQAECPIALPIDGLLERYRAANRIHEIRRRVHMADGGSSFCEDGGWEFPGVASGSDFRGENNGRQDGHRTGKTIVFCRVTRIGESEVYDDHFGVMRGYVFEDTGDDAPQLAHAPVVAEGLFVNRDQRACAGQTGRMPGYADVLAPHGQLHRRVRLDPADKGICDVVVGYMPHWAAGHHPRQKN